MYKFLSLFIITSLVTFLVSIYLSDYTVELILDRIHFKKTLYPCGLDPRSSRQMIANHSLPIHYLKLHGYLTVNADDDFVTKQGIVVDPSISRMNSAVIIVHGASASPAHMKHWVNKITGMRNNMHDIYVPLLDCHGQNIINLTKVSNKVMQQKLIEDIMYIASLGYNKIICIGHSFGGSHLIDLALGVLPESLREKITFIVYSPALFVKMSTFQKLLLALFAPFKKYLTFKFEKNYSKIHSYLVQDEHCYAFYPFTIKSITDLLKLDRLIQNKLRKNPEFIKNLYIVLTKTDGVCNYSYGKSLDKCATIKVLAKGGHNPEFSKDQMIRDEFYRIIEELLDVTI